MFLLFSDAVAYAPITLLADLLDCTRFCNFVLNKFVFLRHKALGKEHYRLFYERH
ncbi:hypothetical protein Hanom_Chr11g01035261 [Helianthus anomalus]